MRSRGVKGSPYASGCKRCASVAALAALVVGCKPITCDRAAENNKPALYSEGTLEDGIYMSSPWDGELLFFPGGMRYKLAHKLRRAPRVWQAYLSFDRYGTEGIGGGSPDEGTPGTLAPAAGNQAEVICVDDQSLIVVNGSCSDYWLLMVAETGKDSDAADGAAIDKHCDTPKYSGQ
jgi:hypothetical protein